MTLILLVISLTIAMCVIAYNFAIYALPFMVGLSAFQYVHGMEAGFLMSGLAAIGAALLSVALVIAVVGFAKNPALRLIALAVFAIPATIAGYALVHGVTKNFIDSTVALNLLGGAGGLFIGVAALLNLNALGTAILSR
ncbi:hypothetical protein G3A56_20330 [Rhizobium oryzihabitans]|uniref:Uncharacterized protein n=2 Tax=Rhizobium TaxID=379 RepID=A0A285V241_9HYPH|nr:MULTISPECIES: hypothetical protein [Hyphomicrobiales]MCQ9148329.1 hypothetical protein [Ochrobactrum sp. BTU2]QIB40244.1 hypothetical protein G3A56_20330 [Rhizobium oryzihabitans]SOC48007.1 hypothetical protein SAMN05892877_13521 [Rhizobium subbaraonis]